MQATVALLLDDVQRLAKILQCTLVEDIDLAAFGIKVQAQNIAVARQLEVGSGMKHWDKCPGVKWMEDQNAK